MALMNNTKQLLRNAIVRSALTYGLQTLELTSRDKRSIDCFTFYWLRQVQDNYWPRKPQKPQRAQLHIATRKPKSTSRIQNYG